jgi:hypothetical protein
MHKNIYAFLVIFFFNSLCFADEIKIGTYKSETDKLLKVTKVDKKTFQFEINVDPSEIVGIAKTIGKDYKMVQNDCTLMFSSKKNIISVDQEGNCGFGLNQNAIGKYTKVK